MKGVLKQAGGEEWQLRLPQHGYNRRSSQVMERSIMERGTSLRIGDWCVDPISGQISRDGTVAHVETRALRLLLCLGEHAGEVVSIDDLLNHVWPDATVSQDSVYQAVASLRRLLGDDPKQPVYIATVPRLGYRMVATVCPWVDKSVEQQQARASTTLRKANSKWFAVAALCMALLIILLGLSKVATRHSSASAAVAAQPQNSIAVLPFLDLTEGMKEEEFADGMTEELIGRLSKIPGLRVPAPTAVFYFKGKQVPIAEMARRLGVAYVLDGSIRKSGPRLRVAARLIRPDNGYVIWTETYDRPFDDILMVQDDIAGEVTKALPPSIETGTSR